MKKTWVKREHIYYKPFYKEKSKMLLLLIFLLGIVFFAYQAFSINQLPSTNSPWSLEGTMQGIREKHKQMRLSLGHRDSDVPVFAGAGWAASTKTDAEEPIQIIRGIRLFDYDSYKPNFEGKFRCLDGSASIPFAWLNDDFCDCPGDGSDEPSTNACANGRFYCKYQKRHITGRGLDTWVASSRVNDGICDCCDGSDEWHSKTCENVCT